ncbi:protein MULTIPLE CHLOROPLAST DIVISION SITE 1 isoform X2 [Phoenix dactylifera]|uniref:Protein MULTIPLE CHLOROPLAST DIVISION SITE 1 isoform X2 n=1 Tax=Phoenix dactylifera TaxID=42345 RepID=A0A8B7BWA1_PHODC|nr:protein MULTIPLE CHLOROPLAST DIVISION SITE 1 isoform X2 [Phoenix dactylifera]
MTSMTKALSLLPFQSIFPQGWNSKTLQSFRLDSRWLRRTRGDSRPLISVRASGDALDSSGDSERAGDGTPVEVEGNRLDLERKLGSFRELGNALPPAVLVIKRNSVSKFAIALYIAFAFLAIAARQIMLKKKNHHQGSVADLVRRGQLRSDRRGISKPMKYDDPFNNPFIKFGKGDSTIEMFGKVYRLASVTLTKEQQSVHQKRRSRAYQWKRPTIFLKEGDPIPPDVDPETVRWIPANHPFATTASDIDEDVAQHNVYQKHGVPFRVKAEHEALQRKLESLQSEQKLNEVALDLNNIRDFERPFKTSMKPQDPEPNSSANQQNGLLTLKSDEETGTSDGESFSGELKKY